MYTINIVNKVSANLFLTITVKDISNISFINIVEFEIKKIIPDNNDFVLYYINDLIYNKNIIKHVVNILKIEKSITLLLINFLLDDATRNYCISKYIKYEYSTVVNINSINMNSLLILKNIFIYHDTNLYRLILNKLDDITYLRTILSLDGLLLNNVADKFKNNKELVLIAIRNNVDALQYASDELKNNKEIAINAINIYYLSLKYLSNNIKDNKKLVLHSINIDGRALYYASDRLKNDKQVVLSAVKKYPDTIECASDRLKADKDIILSAFLCTDSLNCVHYRTYILFYDKNMALDVLNIYKKPILKFSSNNITTDEEIVLKSIELSIDDLAYASIEIKNNKNFIIKITKKYGSVMQYLLELKQDKDVLLESIKKDKDALNYASDKLKNDKEVILEAVKINGLALYYASTYLKNDEEVVLEAIKNNPLSLYYAADCFKSNKESINS